MSVLGKLQVVDHFYRTILLKYNQAAFNMTKNNKESDEVFEIISTTKLTKELRNKRSLTIFPVKLSIFYYNIITSWKIFRTCMNEININPAISK